ncbi:hypothetical protein LVJ94_44440 [Pendulispora rubella]|uniref:DUF3352 domain-containing protein n=1 Tax=Pendulispora rubella TaxID=2741070 RepID=A0ABZ2L410_9BACT
MKALLATSVVLVAGALAFFLLRTRPVENGIVLCGARVPQAPVPPALDEPLFAAVALSLTDEERRTLETVLADANTRWEARANPLLDDLGDGEPDDAFDAWLERAPTPVAVAYAASSPRFCATDGFCVEVLMPASSCSPGFAPVTGHDLERARFLAWPFAHAAWLHAGSEADAARIADTLRAQARARSPKGQMGLVLQAGDELRAREPPFAELRERFLRHEALKRLAKDAGAALEAMKKDAPGERTFPIRLAPADVLVLPGLEALTHRDAFEAELRPYR